MIVSCQFCNASNEVADLELDVPIAKKCNGCHALILTWRFPITRLHCNSTFVKEVEYETEVQLLTFVLHNGKHLKYFVPLTAFIALAQAESIGKHYHAHIHGKYLSVQAPVILYDHMADKIIKLKINLKKVKKEWLFEGKDGNIYLDCTLLYNEAKDQYENNGPIVQDVPKAVYEANKQTKGEILGNGKVMEKTGGDTGGPGMPAQGAPLPPAFEDLPF